jgi:carbon monoxide dehydrogenase subunit G
VQIHGERHFDAAPEDVFRALTDPDEMSAAFSAIELVEAHGTHWTLTVRLPLPGGVRIRVAVHVEEIREPEHARLRAAGKSRGGRVSVNSSFDLAPEGAGTLMHWTAEVDGAGLLRGMGSQALAPVATHQAERALERIARHLEAAPTT